MTATEFQLICRKDMKKDQESGKYHEFTNKECLKYFEYNYNLWMDKEEVYNK